MCKVPPVSQTSRRSLRAALVALCLALGVALCSGASAQSIAYLEPTLIGLTVPTISHNRSGAAYNGSVFRDGTSASTAFWDDVLLTSLSFGTVKRRAGGAVTFNAARGDIQGVQAARVRDYVGTGVNVDYGYYDDNVDGNSDPITKSGVLAPGTNPEGYRESTSASIQNRAIARALGDLSITEGYDTEDGSTGAPVTASVDLLFQKGIRDNNASADNQPELVFFERGANSQYRIQLIIGGTWDNPTLATKYVDVDSSNSSQAWNSGEYILTHEIADGNPSASGQELAISGFDLSDFGLTTNDAVYGVRITSLNSSGVDIFGAFATGTSSSQWVTVPPSLLPTSNTPEPPVRSVLLVGGVACLVLRRWRK